MADIRLFPLDGARRRHPDVDHWFATNPSPLTPLARRWFSAIRQSGADVHDLLHDGHPTACVGALAFAYVNVFREHVNLGFYLGTSLLDPAGLLQGSGRYMRHVKLGRGVVVDDGAVRALIRAAYADMSARATAPPPGEF